MTLERWMARAFARSALLALALATFILSLIALIEAGAGGRDPWAALLQLPLGLREALPVLMGLSVALTLARMRERKTLLSLGASGVPPWRVQLLAVLGVAAVGTPAALGLERLAPVARDAAAERGAHAGGQALSVAGRWAATERGLLRLGDAEAGHIDGLVLIEVQEGALQRALRAGPLRADGAGWRADSVVSIEITENGPAEVRGEVGALPPPEAQQRLARRGAPSEAGLWELDHKEGAWRRHRSAGLLGPAAVAWTVAAVSLVAAAPPAGAALLAALALGSWQLMALALADTPLSGGAPLGALGVVALLAATRPTVWDPRGHADVVE